MPEERQDTCQYDYSNASWSWDTVLEPHRRKPNQPKTELKVVYGPAKGDLEITGKAAANMKLLETVAGILSDQDLWPRPVSLEF